MSETITHTFMLDVFDLEHHYTTPEAIKARYEAMVGVDGKTVPYFDLKSNRDPTVRIGRIIEARFVEHENGCFLECVAEVWDERAIALPRVYLGNVLRAAANVPAPVA